MDVYPISQKHDGGIPEAGDTPLALDEEEQNRTIVRMETMKIPSLSRNIQMGINRQCHEDGPE
jgi:hypothetical protein